MTSASPASGTMTKKGFEPPHLWDLSWQPTQRTHTSGRQMPSSRGWVTQHPHAASLCGFCWWQKAKMCPSWRRFSQGAGGKQGCRGVGLAQDRAEGARGPEHWKLLHVPQDNPPWALESTSWGCRGKRPRAGWCPGAEPDPFTVPCESYPALSPQAVTTWAGTPPFLGAPARSLAHTHPQQQNGASSPPKPPVSFLLSIINRAPQTLPEDSYANTLE